MSATPSQVAERIGRLLILPSAYKKAEAEQAASLIIHTLADLQSDWAPVKWDDVSAFCRKHADDEAFRVLRSPFFRPDVHELVKRGFATWSADEGVGLTQLGIEKACAAVGLSWLRESIEEEGGKP